MEDRQSRIAWQTIKEVSRRKSTTKAKLKATNQQEEKCIYIFPRKLSAWSSLLPGTFFFCRVTVFLSYDLSFWSRLVVGNPCFASYKKFSAKAPIMVTFFIECPSCIHQWLDGHTKDSKMVLDASLLNTQLYKVQIKGNWSNSRKGVAP